MLKYLYAKKVQKSYKEEKKRVNAESAFTQINKEQQQHM